MTCSTLPSFRRFRLIYFSLLPGPMFHTFAPFCRGLKILYFRSESPLYYSLGSSQIRPVSPLYARFGQHKPGRNSRVCNCLNNKRSQLGPASGRPSQQKQKQKVWPSQPSQPAQPSPAYGRLLHFTQCSRGLKFAKKVNINII